MRVSEVFTAKFRYDADNIIKSIKSLALKLKLNVKRKENLNNIPSYWGQHGSPNHGSAVKYKLNLISCL